MKDINPCCGGSKCMRMYQKSEEDYTYSYKNKSIGTMVVGMYLEENYLGSPQVPSRTHVTQLTECSIIIFLSGGLSRRAFCVVTQNSASRFLLHFTPNNIYSYIYNHSSSLLVVAEETFRLQS